MSTSTSPEPSTTIDPGRVLSGLTFIAVGVAFWFYREGRVDGLDLATFWPVALMLWGLSGLIARPRHEGQGAILFLVGAFLLLNNLGYSSWPLVLVALGGLLVWRGWRDDAPSDEERTTEAEVRHGG